jgi:hypothetical protein
LASAKGLKPPDPGSELRDDIEELESVNSIDSSWLTSSPGSGFFVAVLPYAIRIHCNSFVYLKWFARVIVRIFDPLQFFF